MTPIVKQCFKNSQISRLASVGILGKEREPGVGKLDWHGNFGTRFEMNYFVISFKIPCVGFLNFFEIATALLVYQITGCHSANEFVWFLLKKMRDSEPRQTETVNRIKMLNLSTQLFLRPLDVYAKRSKKLVYTLCFIVVVETYLFPLETHNIVLKFIWRP